MGSCGSALVVCEIVAKHLAEDCARWQMGRTRHGSHEIFFILRGTVVQMHPDGKALPALVGLSPIG